MKGLFCFCERQKCWFFSSHFIQAFSKNHSYFSCIFAVTWKSCSSIENKIFENNQQNHSIKNWIWVQKRKYLSKFSTKLFQIWKVNSQKASDHTSQVFPSKTHRMLLFSHLQEKPTHIGVFQSNFGHCGLCFCNLTLESYSWNTTVISLWILVLISF